MEQKSVMGIVIVLALAVIVINTTEISNPLTGKATTNIEACEDSDGGIVAGIGGNVRGSYNPTSPLRDFCVNSTTVGEYYCDGEKTDGKLKDVYCEFGCIVENSVGFCKPSRPIICIQNECAFEGKCLPINSRSSGQFCNLNAVMESQKAAGSCNDHHECKSNLCISGTCLSEQGGLNFIRDAETTYFWE